MYESGDYEFAKARGARIYCEIKGYGFSSDAFHMTSPSTEGPARAMKMTIKDSGLSPEQIDYVNAHGTSTPKNDLSETLAIRLAFGEYAHSVPVSSTKSMIGHALGGAGALEAVACIKTIMHNEIHPTIN